MPQGSGRYRLVVRRGPTPGQTWELAGELVTVGREASNDIVVVDPGASRQHLRLKRSDSAWFLEDLGSTNGTFLNGERISGARSLQEGDMIGLGDVVMLSLERAPAESDDALADVPESLSSLPATPPPVSAAAPPRGLPPGEEAAPAYEYEPLEDGEEPPRSPWRMLAIGCAALLLLCCCVFTLGIVVVDLACLWESIPLLSDLLIDVFGVQVTC